MEMKAASSFFSVLPLIPFFLIIYFFIKKITSCHHHLVQGVGQREQPRLTFPHLLLLASLGQ